MRYEDPVPNRDAVSDPAPVRGALKCLVWDLDETLWSGTLLEGGAGSLAPGVEAAIRELDRRGILQSVASKNDHDVAWAQLEALGVAEYFLHPQIGWWSKAGSIERIAERLGIGLDAVAFIDDQEVERQEVTFYLPQVTVFETAQLPGLIDDPRLKPRFVTAESRSRRSMYVADAERQAAQDRFDGPRDAFLSTLAMRMTIRRATVDDLERAGELTVRTNQLNTTGRAYSHAELAALIESADHLVLIAQLDDRFGSSGTIGLALVELDKAHWTIRLLIMSCRVVSRGIGSVLLGHIIRRAREQGAAVRAMFVPTGRNKQMFVTFKFAGFRTLADAEDGQLLEHDPARPPAIPSYVEVVSDLPSAEAA